MKLDRQNVSVDTPLKVVITGASGFLGKHVLRLLLEKPHVETIAVTRREIPGFLKVSDYAESPAGDVLIHLAEDGDRAQVANLGKVYEESVQATLRALLAKGFQRIVYASSAVLYGDSNTQAHSPGSTIKIIDAYTRIKRKSEMKVLESPAGVVVRLANLYGIGMSQNNVMSAILRQIPGKGVVKVMDSCPVRDFLWVDDAAKGIIRLALGHLHENGKEKLYNLGTSIGTSIGDLVSLALEISGQPDRPVESNSLTHRLSCLILEYSDTTNACGWFPETSLRQGLTQLIRAEG